MVEGNTSFLNGLLQNNSWNYITPYLGRAVRSLNRTKTRVWDQRACPACHSVIRNPTKATVPPSVLARIRAAPNVPSIRAAQQRLQEQSPLQTASPSSTSGSKAVLLNCQRHQQQHYVARSNILGIGWMRIYLHSSTVLHQTLSSFLCIPTETLELLFILDDFITQE